MSIYHIRRIDYKGEDVIVGVTHTNGLATIMDSARRYGGDVFKPKYNWASKEWSVVDNIGNVFLAEEQIN